MNSQQPTLSNHLVLPAISRPVTEIPRGKKLRRILLLTADERLKDLSPDFLSRGPFCIHAIHDGTSGLAECLTTSYDLVIIDAVLPVLDGFGVLQELRTRSAVPVLLMAECEEQCTAGLEAGSDDFILKPFSLGELATRVLAVLRRTEKTLGASASILRCDDLSVNLRSHQAWVGEEALALTNVEFAILKCLIRCAGRIVSRDEMTAVLYQRKSTPFERSIDVHISHLRKKIERATRVSIRTMRGIGYLLAA